MSSRRPPWRSQTAHSGRTCRPIHSRGHKRPPCGAPTRPPAFHHLGRGVELPPFLPSALANCPRKSWYTSPSTSPDVSLAPYPAAWPDASTIPSGQRQAPGTRSPGCGTRSNAFWCSAGSSPGSTPIRIAHHGQHVLPLFHKPVGDVCEEDQAQHQMLVFGGVHLGAGVVGTGPEHRFDIPGGCFLLCPGTAARGRGGKAGFRSLVAAPPQCPCQGNGSAPAPLICGFSSQEVRSFNALARAMDPPLPLPFLTGRNASALSLICPYSPSLI